VNKAHVVAFLKLENQIVSLEAFRIFLLESLMYSNFGHNMPSL